MLLRILCAIGFIGLLSINYFALVNDLYWLNILAHIGFFIVAYLLFFNKSKSFNFYFYLFLGLTIVSYLLEMLNQFWYFREISLFIQAVSFLPIILEAGKHFEMKYMSYLMLIYFFGIIGINTYLLLLHINEMSSYLSGNGIMLLYALYYLSVGALGIIALVYSMNSHSKKSMFFVTFAICLIFANVLRDMGVFYFKDISVEISESIMRMGSALFLVLFFITVEKKLKFANFL